MKATEYGRQRIMSKDYRELSVDYVLVQRDRHKLPPDEILEGLRLFTALELAMKERGKLPSVEELRDLREFGAANIEIIDAALLPVLKEVGGEEWITHQKA